MQRQIVRFIILLVVIMLAISVAAQGTPPPPPPGGNGGPPQGEPPQGGPQNDEPLEINANFQAVPSTYTGIATVTMGSGEALGDFSLTSGCTTNARFESGGSGVVTTDDGQEIILPMEVNEGAGTVDMYNDCTSNGDNPDYLNQLETIVIDEDGEVITAHIFADNYFELYINGQFVGRDNINFIPFNSTAVRFQASYPLTIAVNMADWETHYGIGMEYDRYNVGDAGFIMWMDNGVVTNADWKVYPVYIAPLDDPACVVEDEFGNADASGCSISPECSRNNPEMCRALHYVLPENWMMPDFDDSNWQTATLYNAEDVTNQPGYADYAGRFGDAMFIWSPSLKLDNHVVARYTVE